MMGMSTRREGTNDGFCTDITVVGQKIKNLDKKKYGEKVYGLGLHNTKEYVMFLIQNGMRVSPSFYKAQIEKYNDKALPDVYLLSVLFLTPYEFVKELKQVSLNEGEFILQAKDGNLTQTYFSSVELAKRAFAALTFKNPATKFVDPVDVAEEIIVDEVEEI